MDTDFYPDGRLAPCALAEGLFTGRTPGGLRVVVRRDARSPVAVCNVWVRAGSNREPESLRGWSHGIEHMLFKGTHRRGERDFALEVAAAGGSTNAGTGYETTNYHITVPAARLPVAIDILGDALLCSRFEEAALDAERQVLVHENHMYDDIPFGFGVTWRWGLELAFDRSPYRHPIGGQDENLLTCPRERVMAYWRSAYHPTNMVAVVVGDVVPALLELIEEEGCDAVIMGSHGMGLVRSALGSVSRGMLEQAPVPVTFVKAPPEPEDTEEAADEAPAPEAD